MAKLMGRARLHPMMVERTAIWNVSIKGLITLSPSSTHSQGIGQNFSQSGFDQTSQNVEGLKPTLRAANTVNATSARVMP